MAAHGVHRAARRAARLKGTFLSEPSPRSAAAAATRRRVVAVAHEILIAAHRVLDSDQPCIDPGPEALRSLSAEHVKRPASPSCARSATG